VWPFSISKRAGFGNKARIAAQDERDGVRGPLFAEGGGQLETTRFSFNAGNFAEQTGELPLSSLRMQRRVARLSSLEAARALAQLVAREQQAQRFGRVQALALAAVSLICA
jgi:hypothetical protein